MSPSNATPSAYFVIADISGYTGFLAENDLVHAHGVISELTSLLIEKLSSPFRFVELEGDAVFVYAPSPAVEDSERLLEILEDCYGAFRLCLEQMQTNTSCGCSACSTISDLDLKFVAHFGDYLPQETPNGTQLMGPDVVLLHRMLKNSVSSTTGIQAYAFLTDAFVGRAFLADTGLGLQAHEEQYPDVGKIHGRVVDLVGSAEVYRKNARIRISEDDADLLIEATLDAPASIAWAYFIEAERRKRWQRDTTSVETKPGDHSRMGVGVESHCDHGSYRLNHRIVDWQPFRYITMDTKPLGRSLKAPPPGYCTFEFEPIGEDQCFLSMRLRVHNRGLGMRLLLAAIGRLVVREWENHYTVLNEVLADDASKVSPTV